VFDTSTENTCEEFRQYDDDKPTPCYAATHYGLRDADAYSRNKGELIYPPTNLNEELNFAIIHKYNQISITQFYPYPDHTYAYLDWRIFRKNDFTGRLKILYWIGLKIIFTDLKIILLGHQNNYDGN